MTNTNTSPEGLAQMGSLVLANFKILNKFAKENRLTISGVYAYIAVGSMSIVTTEDGKIMFTPFSPSRAAAQLNFNLHKIGRLFLTLVDRGLLSCERGTYQVTDFDKWVNIASLLNFVMPNLEYAITPKHELSPSLAAISHLRVARNHRGTMRDRL